MPEPTNLHVLISRANVAIQEFKANLGIFWSKRVGLVWLALSKAVLLNILLTEESTLEAVSNSFWMVWNEVAKATDASIFHSLTSTCDDPTSSPPSLIHVFKTEFSPGNGIRVVFSRRESSPLLLNVRNQIGFFPAAR